MVLLAGFVAAIFLLLLACVEAERELKADVSPSASARLSDLGLSPQLYDELFSKALMDHVKENACYQSVTDSVRSYGLSSSLSDEMLRKRGAIALFLCDAAADSISTPQECEHDVGTFEWSESQVQGCVHALHRVPQQWASFDNHRKTFPLLCFAQMQREGVDEARNVYRDIAIQQQKFLLYLHGAAKERQQLYEGMERSARSAMEQLQREARHLQLHQVQIVRTQAQAILSNLSTSLESMTMRSAANISRTGQESLRSTLRVLQKTATEVIQASVSRSSALAEEQHRNFTFQTHYFQDLVQQTFSPDGPLSKVLQTCHHQQQAAALQLRTQSSQSNRIAQEVWDVLATLRDTATATDRALYEERKRAAEEEAHRKTRDQQGRDVLLKLVAGLFDDPQSLDWTELVTTILLRQGIPPWCGTILTSLFHLVWWALSNVLWAVAGWTLFALTWSRRLGGAALHVRQPRQSTVAVTGNRGRLGPESRTDPRRLRSLATRRRSIAHRDVRAASAPL
ncbi:hypothetical protein A4X09_0g1911 [Tilletia walkeri]|uniref:Nuclear fusion protein KAR5 n=1 Tax=Tilletia walkeri TaxID=117179 RepID=A0A8X7NE87_9BASI|nr:hypothetical protein A4X09_0g1911 [Tilletia walkeri]